MSEIGLRDEFVYPTAAIFVILWEASDNIRWLFTSFWPCRLCAYKKFVEWVTIRSVGPGWGKVQVSSPLPAPLMMLLMLHSHTAGRGRVGWKQLHSEILDENACGKSTNNAWVKTSHLANHNKNGKSHRLLLMGSRLGTESKCLYNFYNLL
jgi:hypothetical protein